LKRPSWLTTVLAGLALGAAQLTKMTWLVLYALYPVIWLLWRGLDRYADGFARGAAESQNCSRPVSDRSKSPTAWQLTVILAISVYVLNLGYAFDGTAARLGGLTFVSRLLTGQGDADAPGNRFADTALADLPVPLPAQYLLGFDSQRRDFESFHQESYLLGEWKSGGWWYYYLCGFLFKLPCGTWFLVVAVLCHRRWQQLSRDTRGELIPLIMAGAVFVLVSSQKEVNLHLRYAFPALGLGLVLLGQSYSLFQSKSRLLRSGGAILLVYAVVSPLFVFPHHLAYFNDFVGGPAIGHKYLLRSSMDWGQDWLYLRRWLEEHPEIGESGICVSHKGSEWARAMGIAEPCAGSERFVARRMEAHLLDSRMGIGSDVRARIGYSMVVVGQ